MQIFSSNKKLSNLIKYIRYFLNRYCNLLIGVAIVSFLQASTLTYRDYGSQAFSSNFDLLQNKSLPKGVLNDYLFQLDPFKVIIKINTYIFELFFAQCIPVLIYGSFQSKRTKKIAALTIWLFPILISLPTLAVPVAYILSPLASISHLPFLSNPSTEVFAEEVFFFVAVVGWFNIFWMVITMKCWFCVK